MYTKNRLLDALTITLLWIGDILFLIAYAFEFEYFDSNPSRPLFDLLIAFLPLIIAWSVIAILLHGSSPVVSWWIFIKRSVLCWIIALAKSYFIQALILWFSMRRIHLPLPILVDGFIGLVLLIVWRTIYKLFYNLVTLPRFIRIKKVIWGVLVFSIIIIIAIPIPSIYSQFKYSSRIYTAETTPHRPVALVLGAGVWSTGTPSSLLIERVRKAASLYQLGKVEKLLLTADNRSVANYETDVMRELAKDLGVPESALIMDTRGYSTTESCQRASSVYHVSSVLIVSQYFQLPRAMFLCESSGLEVAGIVSADGSVDLKSLILWYLREIPANVFALFQVILFSR